jgi:hypothetical protein
MLLGVAAALVLLGWQRAQAQLVVYPTRVLMERSQRAEQLEIINNSGRSVTYLITVQNRRMDAEGRFSAADTAAPGEQFADSMLRYSPRRVTLAPGASQVVRIMARRPADLVTGEYRSHLLFAEQPNPEGATSIEKPKENATDIGVALTALVGISIPVIVRSGETAATVTLDNLALSDGAGPEAPLVSVDLHRSGNRSVYGDFTASLEPAGGGRTIDIGRAAGVAVYTPNELRHVRFPLTLPPNMALTGGTLTVSFRERDGTVVSRTALRLP